jgi:hypothetical protein
MAELVHIPVEIHTTGTGFDGTLQIEAKVGRVVVKAGRLLIDVDRFGKGTIALDGQPLSVRELTLRLADDAMPVVSMTINLPPDEDKGENDEPAILTEQPASQPGRGV